jgi:hypothetical protein
MFKFVINLIQLSWLVDVKVIKLYMCNTEIDMTF